MGGIKVVACTVWHENLTVFKFYGLPKLLREKVDGF